MEKVRYKDQREEIRRQLEEEGDILGEEKKCNTDEILLRLEKKFEDIQNKNMILEKKVEENKQQIDKIKEESP